VTKVIDPDEMLQELRDMVKVALKEGNLDAMQLAFKFQELDGWLTKRGFLPREWSAWVTP
jgi:hypothetical protein